MSYDLDEHTVQRCVDGELNEVEQQALLCQLERTPAGWRAVALAFIEHQVWSQAGLDFVRTPAASTASEPSQGQPLRVRGSWLRSTALVASTLVAIGLGYLGGSRKDSSRSTDSPLALAPSLKFPTQNVSTNGGRPNPVEAVPSSRRDRSGLTPVMQVELIPEGTDSRPIPMAVYDGKDIQQYEDWMTPRLSTTDRQDIEEQGFQVFEEPFYYTVPIDNHRHLVVPVNTIRVRQQLQ